MRFTQNYRDEQAAPPADGLASSIKKVVSASGRYVSARARLLALEAGVAAAEVKGLLVLCLIASASLLAGSLLLLVALIIWIARQFMEGDHALASCAVGGVLLGAAFLMIWRVRKTLSGQNYFPVTKAEFNLDKQWLQDLPQRTHGSNGTL